METYTKNEEGNLEVTKLEVVEAKTATYDVGFLKQQLIDIQKQKDDFDAQRDVEIVEVLKLLAQCKRLSVVEKVELTKEVTVEDIK